MGFEEKPEDASTHKCGVVLSVVAFFGIGEIAHALEGER